MPRVWPSSQVATTTAGRRLGDRHIPGGRRPLGPANVDGTEDRGYVVWRIKEDLKGAHCTHVHHLRMEAGVADVVSGRRGGHVAD